MCVTKPSCIKKILHPHKKMYLLSILKYSNSCYLKISNRHLCMTFWKIPISLFVLKGIRNNHHSCLVGKLCCVKRNILRLIRLIKSEAPLSLNVIDIGGNFLFEKVHKTKTLNALWQNNLSGSFFLFQPKCLVYRRIMKVLIVDVKGSLL